MKLLFSLIISALVFTLNSQATLPVVDYAGNIQNEINDVAAYVRQGMQYVEEQTTALKEIQQVENEIEQLSRMGNPSQLMHLSGVSEIQTLAEIIQNFKTQVAQLETLVNPANAVSTANQVLQTYGQTPWNGFTAANGTQIAPNVGMIQFSASNYNTLSAVQQTVQTLQQKKLSLSQSRDQAISALQSATDQSTIFKQSAIIQALNGAIADINASIAQASEAGHAQQQKNQAAQQISQAMQAQQQAANAYQAIDGGTGMAELPSAGFRQLALWPQ